MMKCPVATRATVLRNYRPMDKSRWELNSECEQRPYNLAAIEYKMLIKCNNVANRAKVAVICEFDFNSCLLDTKHSSESEHYG